MVFGNEKSWLYLTTVADKKSSHLHDKKSSHLHSVTRILQGISILFLKIMAENEEAKLLKVAYNEKWQRRLTINYSIVYYIQHICL